MGQGKPLGDGMCTLISWLLVALPQSYTDALKQGLVGMEVLDHRELRYILNDKSTYANDLELIGDRAARLHTAPHLWEADRFPERDYCNGLMSFNRSYRLYIENRIVMEPDRASIGRTILRECDVLYSVWDSVRDAKCEYYYVSVRREALKRVKEVMPLEMWLQGNLPAHVPFWRFVDE